MAKENTNQINALEKRIKSGREATVDNFKKSVKYGLITLGIGAVAKAFDTPVVAIPAFAGIMYFGAYKLASSIAECYCSFEDSLNDIYGLKDLKESK